MSALEPRPPAGPHCYRFCDVVLSLSARCPEALEGFAQAYGACRVAVDDPSCDPAATVACWLDTDHAGSGTMVLDGVSHPVGDHSVTVAHSLVVDGVAAHSRTHLFVHAAAVSVAGRALLLAGPSGHGKSTLAQALAAQGATVLCDDVAPVAIAGGTVTAFPPPAPPEELPAAVAVTDVVLLHVPQTRQSLHLALDRLPDGWQNTPPWGERTPVTLRQRDGYCELVAANLAPGMVEEIEQACREAGAVILRDLGLAAPEFGPTPRVAPVARATGLTGLVSHLFGRGGRDATELAWNLARSLGQARFWVLHSGPPADTAEALLHAVAAPPTAP